MRRTSAATRNGIVRLVAGAHEARGLRSQFSHLDRRPPRRSSRPRGSRRPSAVNGVAQQPIDGTSLVYTFDAPRAPERHGTQYFEMMGNRAIYHDGWSRARRPRSAPGSGASPTSFPPTTPGSSTTCGATSAQANDLAAREPGKLAELRAIFDREAERNQRPAPRQPHVDGPLHGDREPDSPPAGLHLLGGRRQHPVARRGADREPVLRDHGRPRVDVDPRRRRSSRSGAASGAGASS
jgi:hypothetical protein